MPSHLHQRLDVMHHRLHAGSDRLKAGQPQQVHRCRSQRGHHPSAIAPITVGVLMQLGVTDPVPSLNAPALPNLLQQRFWSRPQAREGQVGCLKRLSVASAGCLHLHDPAGAGPGLTDVLRDLFGPQNPGDLATMADLVIRYHKRDLAFPLELAADLAMQCCLVGLDRQEKYGALLLELPKNGGWVWSASA